MPASVYTPYREPASSTTRWVVLFVVLSILAHVVVFLAVFLIARFVPEPKLPVPKPDNPTVNLTFVPPPPPLHPPTPPKPHSQFIPTAPDPSAKPDPKVSTISDNNSAAKSQNTKPRDPDSPLPDVTGQKNNSLDLQTNPLIQSQQHPAQPTPPSPKPSPQPPTPPKPQPQQVKPTPPEPNPKPAPQPQPKPNNSQAKPPEVNSNGLPVLPPLPYATIAPQTPPDPTQQTKSQKASPPPSFQLNKSDISGSANASGPNSAAANATALGRYKAKVYRAVGSLWYDKVGKQLSLLPVGSVRVSYTIYADGTVTTKVLDGGNGTMELLLSISVNSIRESAPYDKFDDYPGLREELAKTQAGNGDSFTDDFTFSVYSP